MKFQLIRLVAGLALAAGILVSLPAFAQKKKDKKVTEIGEFTIIGRVQKPVAAVDIVRLAPKLTLSELRQPFLDRIEQVILKDPF